MPFDWLMQATAARPFTPEQRASWIKDQEEHCRAVIEQERLTKKKIRAFEASRKALKKSKKNLPQSQWKKGFTVKCVYVGVFPEWLRKGELFTISADSENGHIVIDNTKRSPSATVQMWPFNNAKLINNPVFELV